MTLGETIAELQRAYNKGVEIGMEQNELRRKQRKVIAGLLKKERTEKGWTQEEVSTKINANLLTYRGYENEKSDIPIYYLRRLADLYGVTMDYMIGRSTTSEPEADMNRLYERVSKLEELVQGLTQPEQTDAQTE